MMAAVLHFFQIYFAIGLAVVIGMIIMLGLPRSPPTMQDGTPVSPAYRAMVDFGVLVFTFVCWWLMLALFIYGQFFKRRDS